MRTQTSTAKPVEALIALGSNIGDKIGFLRLAYAELSAHPAINRLAASKIYQTPPWGKTDQDWFVNAVLKIKTDLSPEVLLDVCLAIEAKIGRKRAEHWGPRVIDIDILNHGRAKRNHPHLTLPHPEMVKRAFVLLPLRDVAPEKIINGLSIKQHLQQLDCSGIVAIASF